LFFFCWTSWLIFSRNSSYLLICSFVQNLFKAYSQPNISLVHFSCYCYHQDTHTHTHERVTLNVNNLFIFIFMLIGLIRFNPFDLWPKSYFRLTLKLSFKIMIINTFIFTLIWFNSTHDLGLDWWLELCLGLTLELSFKIMIITIFFLTYFSWIILELKVFYKDILEIKNKKYYL